MEKKSKKTVQTVKKPVPAPVAVPELELNAPLPIEVTPISSQVDEVIVSAKRKWIVGLCLFILFLIMVILMGFGYVKNIDSSPVPTLTPTPQIITPSPTPVIIMRVAVWNGSGIAGLAGKVGNELKTAGYDVVEVANAPQTQKGTTLLLNPNVKSKETELIDVLKKNTIEVSQVDELIKGDYEVQIILGN
jgi:hypothetical protein